jgi:hypothetical protein
MGQFRLNKSLQIVMLAAAGIIIVAGLAAYSGYRSFAAETRGYAGVTFEDTKKVVLYRLGDPDVVWEETKEVVDCFPGLTGPCTLIRSYSTDRTKDPQHAITEGKQAEDYHVWSFNYSKDGHTSVRFDPKTGTVLRISCMEFNTSTAKQCPPLFGIQIDDTESTVLATLGTPTHQEIGETPQKDVDYDDIGAGFILAKERVYSMSQSPPKGDWTAILRRYLTARLSLPSGFWAR